MQWLATSESLGRDKDILYLLVNKEGTGAPNTEYQGKLRERLQAHVGFCI